MTSTSITRRIQKSMNSANSWLFLSPHLDDAILSCGALVQAEAKRREITVATLFTEASHPPHTHAAKAFMRQCASGDADSLFAARRAEDQRVLSGVGAQSIHFGLADALYRRREGSGIFAKLGRLVPELIHRYPTYRFDIAYGRVSKGDKHLIALLQAHVRDLIAVMDAELLFCPLGVGNHVDHVITRTIGSAFPEKVVYYSDFPYNQSHREDDAFISTNYLARWTWSENLAAKRPLIRSYVTQADALFTSGNIPIASEVYYSAS